MGCPPGPGLRHHAHTAPSRTSIPPAAHSGHCPGRVCCTSGAGMLVRQQEAQSGAREFGHQNWTARSYRGRCGEGTSGGAPATQTDRQNRHLDDPLPASGWFLGWLTNALSITSRCSLMASDGLDVRSPQHLSRHGCWHREVSYGSTYPFVPSMLRHPKAGAGREPSSRAGDDHGCAVGIRQLLAACIMCLLEPPANTQTQWVPRLSCRELRSYQSHVVERRSPVWAGTLVPALSYLSPE